MECKIIDSVLTKETMQISSQCFFSQSYTEMNFFFLRF